MVKIPKGYIGPRDQFLKCKEDGTQFREYCHCCGQELLMCKRHGGLCRSNKCRKERNADG